MNKLRLFWKFNKNLIFVVYFGKKINILNEKYCKKIYIYVYKFIYIVKLLRFNEGM